MEASWRRHQGGGIREEASFGRHHGGGTMEEASTVGLPPLSTLAISLRPSATPPGRGGNWEASERLLEGSGRALGVSGGSRAIWGVLGVSAQKMLTTLSPFAFFTKSVNFTMCF